MSNSFYGGKKGFSFTLQPNSLINSNGLFGSLGTSADSAEADSLYGGIKRGDIQPGEYAIVSGGGNAGEIYRASFSTPSNLILCAKIPTLKGEPGDPGPQGQSGADGKDGKDGKDGRAAHWFQGSSDPSGIYEDVHSGDMYLNTTNGNVYRYEDGNWVYEQNIRGPANGTSEIVIEFTDFESNPTQHFYLKPPIGMYVNSVKPLPVGSDSNSITISLASAATITSAFNQTYGNITAYYDLTGPIDNSSIYIYDGGILPPAVYVPSSVVAVFGKDNQNIINWSHNITLKGQYLYIILHSGILPIPLSDSYKLYGFRAYLNPGGGSTLADCSLNIIGKSSSSSATWSDYRSWKLNSNGIATGGNNTDFYDSNGVQKKLLPFDTSTSYGYANPWEVVTDIMGNTQKALVIGGV